MGMKNSILASLLFVGSLILSLQTASYLSYGCSVASLILVGLLVFEWRKSRATGQSQGFQSFYDAFESIMESARTLYGQSENLKKIVMNETAAVESSSSAVNEISSMLEKTAAGSVSLAEIADSSTRAIGKSREEVEILNHLITEVRDSSKELENSVLGSLQELHTVVESMKTIKSKTVMINEIVFQTKLLSFNASVEAARAGEAGKGFAVVAEEMGKLAAHSGAASKEIDSILQSSLENTEKQISKVNSDLSSITSRVISNINKALEKSGIVVSEFDGINDWSQKTNQMSAEISHATGEQSVGVREVSTALNQLDASSNQLKGLADAAYKASFSLANQTDDLSKNLLHLAEAFGARISHRVKPFDFSAAVSAHIDWKMKLSKYMDNPDGSLKPETVCKDNACALGKWIYGDGMAYKDKYGQQYESLRTSHAEFHQTAGDIIKMIDSGNKMGANKLMSPGGKYTQVSERTVGLIQEIRSKVEGSPAQSTKNAA